MQRGIVYVNKLKAGIIERPENGHYLFRYYDEYFTNPLMPPVSLTLPKTKQVYESRGLFPFFYGLLTEGINKDTQCRLLKIDEEDDFTRLLKTAGIDTIGAVTVKEETK
jgi:serine/threonine-protein kinase HipA